MLSFSIVSLHCLPTLANKIFGSFGNGKPKSRAILESNRGDAVEDVGTGQNTKKTAKIASVCLTAAILLDGDPGTKTGEVQCGTTKRDLFKESMTSFPAGAIGVVNHTRIAQGLITF